MRRKREWRGKASKGMNEEKEREREGSKKTNKVSGMY